MCHRLTTRFFPSFQSNSRPFESRPPYGSTVKLGWLMCHGLKSHKGGQKGAVGLTRNI